MKFDTVEYTDWIQKVKKELKLEALDAKHLTLLDGQTFDPFFQRDQHQTFEFTRQARNWLIGEMVELDKSSNAEILSMLEGGTQKLLLINASNDKDFEQLLNGVFLSMVHIHLETENQKVAEQFLTYVQYHCDEEDRKNHSCNLVPINQGLVHTIHIDETNPNALNDFCNKSIDFINQHQNERWETIVNSLRITFEVQNKGIEYIALVDAVKRLWSLICKSFGEIEISPKIEQIVPYDNSLSIDENFISSTVQAVNAVIATGDTLYIQNTPDNSDFSRRINRNIQHLLQLESFMQQSASAYRGSYVIEKISDMMVDKAWSNLSF